MQDNYNQLYYHLIFPTKARLPMIDRITLEKIRECFTKKEVELDFKIYIVNGVKDHVHLLVSLFPKHNIAKIIQHLKGYSSRVIPELYWSRGYSCLTVDAYHFDIVFNYIKNQEEHHTIGV